MFFAKKDKILVHQRARKDAQYNLWDIRKGKLERKENSIHELVREMQKETGISLGQKKFHLLGTVRTHTEYDGKYGLYLFHAQVLDNFPQQLTVKNTTLFFGSPWMNFNYLNYLQLKRSFHNDKG